MYFPILFDNDLHQLVKYRKTSIEQTFYFNLELVIKEYTGMYTHENS